MTVGRAWQSAQDKRKIGPTAKATIDSLAGKARDQSWGHWVVWLRVDGWNCQEEEENAGISNSKVQKMQLGFKIIQYELFTIQERSWSCMV